MIRSSYDFSKARKLPDAKRLEKQVTIRLDVETIRYFKRLAAPTGVSYQALISFYLRGWAVGGRRLEWV